MKKTIVGATFFLSGIIASIGILLCGALNLLKLNGWSGNKLIYSTFNASQLNLGILFTFTVLLGVIGLIIMVIELFSKKSD